MSSMNTRLCYECAELCHEYYYVLVSLEYHIQTMRLAVTLSSLACHSCLQLGYDTSVVCEQPALSAFNTVL